MFEMQQLAKVADYFASEVVTRRRFGPTTNVDGVLTRPAPTTTANIAVFSSPANKNPTRTADGRDFVADRVFTSTSSDWRADDEASGQAGDELVRANGEVFKVMATTDALAFSGIMYMQTTLVRRAP